MLTIASSCQRGFYSFPFLSVQLHVYFQHINDLSNIPTNEQDGFISRLQLGAIGDESLQLLTELRIIREENIAYYIQELRFLFRTVNAAKVISTERSETAVT